jgi:hypothetical protein
MKMQRYEIKDKDNRVLAVFKTNCEPPKGAIPIGDDVEIPGDLYAGDEPRIRHTDRVEEIYPSSPGEDYQWDKEGKVWKLRPAPPDLQGEIESLRQRVIQLEERDARDVPK